MKFQIVSDLHLEFKHKINGDWENVIVPTADILILAGDICYLHNICDDHEDSFWRYVEQNWDRAIYVPGNHEFYQSTLGDSLYTPNVSDPAEHICVAENYSLHINTLHRNVHIVNNDVIEIDGVNFVCSTLWSDIPPVAEYIVKSSLADFRIIGKMNPAMFNSLNRRSCTFLRNTIQTHDNVVVVTHHLPTWQVVTDPYKTDPVTHGFCNSHLDNLIDPKNMKAWIHGHSHDALDEIVNDVRIVRNPYGYMHERNNGYKKDKVIEV